MRKCYLLFFLAILFAKVSFSQCPAVIGAMVNSYGPTEGSNEFVLFTTKASDSVGSYTLSYGSVNPPSTAPTGIMPGRNASQKSSTGTLVSTGCTIHEVTSSATVIPANSTVIFIPAEFDTTYDISGVCATAGGNIYAVYINTTVAPAKWSAAGTLANNPSGTGSRYLQVQYDKTAGCDDSVRRYSDGWPSDANGNYVTWKTDTIPQYTNTGDLVITPLRLLSFTVQQSGKNANLYWQTASEQNTKSFEIDRSDDGVNFTSIGLIAAAGNSSIIRSYAKTDYSIAAGVSFYRIKVIDLDGKINYSSIVKIDNLKNGGGIKAYPDAAGSQLNIEWKASASGNTTAIIYDFCGRPLLQQNIATINGFNHQQLTINILPKAGYILKLVNNGQAIVTRFVKQ